MAPADSTDCGACGAAISAASRFCPHCGNEIVRLTTGEILDGKYEVLDKLAEGGMGVVYRARHLHLDEIRIIKVMKPSALGDATQHARFSEEARLATRIRHPNVAALYDFARLPGGTDYMVWEFIDGTTLLQLLRREGRIPAEEAIEISLQVLAGLSEIHRAGIVHRDISPDNIMIVGRGAGRRAKIIDLGIAKRVAEGKAGLTSTGMFIGKLRYCSPEQAGALPAGERLDGRSDVYSFGAVLYEMLSGRPLFDSPTPEGYLVKHLQEPAPRLPAEGLPATVAPKLAEIVARALEKDRRRRFPSAEDLSAALASLRAAPTETAPTLLAPFPEAERAGSAAAPTVAAAPRRARRVAPFVALACLGLALAGGLAAALRLWRSREAPGRAPAVPSARIAPPAAAPAPSPAPVAPGPAPASPPVRIVAARPSPKAPPPPAARTRAAAATAPAIASPPPALPAPPASPDETDARRRLRDLLRQARGGGIDDVAALVSFVNGYVAAHPDSPLGRQIREQMPLRLRADADAAEAAGERRKALVLDRIYAALDFAPSDPGIAARISALERGRGSGWAGAPLEIFPVRPSPPGQPLVVDVRWPGPATRPLSGRLFFRPVGKDRWSSVALQPIRPAILQAVIPGSDVGFPGIDYYVVAADASGERRHNGSEQAPIRVRISP